MIINTTYFKKGIYLPHAKPGPTSSVTDVESKVLDFIDESEQECLEKCLGIRLATEFFNTLDANKPTYIKDGEDAKWDELLNGKATYTNPNGDTATWKGIRRKSKSLGQTKDCPYDMSFLADYTYFFYESNAFITRASAGNTRVKSANSELEMPNNKVIKAWRRFVKIVQGEDYYPEVFYKSGFLGGPGVDYYNGQENLDVSLYQFIKDQNELVEDTYANFQPKKWGMINQFTI